MHLRIFCEYIYIFFKVSDDYCKHIIVLWTYWSREASNIWRYDRRHDQNERAKYTRKKYGDDGPRYFFRPRLFLLYYIYFVACMENLRMDREQCIWGTSPSLRFWQQTATAARVGLLSESFSDSSDAALCSVSVVSRVMVGCHNKTHWRKKKKERK